MLRAVLTFTAAAVTAGLAMAGTTAVAQQKVYTLKCANFTSAQAATSRWFEKTKKELAEKSGGRLQLQMFYGSSMGPMPRHYDLARTGVADMSFFQHGTTRGRFPLTELFHLPYLVPPGADGSRIASMIAADLKDKYLVPEHKGTKLLWVVFNRPSGVYDATKPITSIEDLKGRRYRAPTPSDVLMLKALGALPIGMPATDMAESLQKGTIDGVVTDPMGVFSFKLGGLVKYYTDMFRSEISFGLVINEKSYAALPDDLKKLIDGLGTRESSVSMATMSWSDFPAFLKYEKDYPLERVRPSAEAEAAMRKAADKVIEQKIAELEKKGLPARAMYKEMKELAAKYSKM